MTSKRAAKRPDRHTEGVRDRAQSLGRTLGLGIITGAADDDPSAIGTYASAGAKLGPSFLWTAPVTYPMMVAVVYLSSKLGQVTGKGLFAVIQEHFPRWILWPALVGVILGDTIEAGADIGGMAAAAGILIPIPTPWIAVGATILILALQIWGSYTLIRSVFRWLALTLLAYIGAAILAKPDLLDVLRGTFLPTLRFDREFLSFLVAVMGTTLSAYLITWQSNQEVEEKIAAGKHSRREREGATERELRHTRWDIATGMFFSNLIMYFIMLSTASTLYETGGHDIDSAADAARALTPLAGDAAGALFAIGVIGVGFLAVPIMTTGAAYSLAQVMGWRHTLHAKPRHARRFYLTITTITLVGMSLNFLGLNPMKMLVWAGIVQGFTTPPLLLLIMLLTNRRSVMGNRVNGRGLNVLGWLTTGAVFAATAGLVATWLL
jgi:NRAMP (natural resistance-associated macrophage protein)-like metal ion transporter